MRAQRTRTPGGEGTSPSGDPEPLCDGVTGNYSVALHLWAVLILLLSSAVGAGFPLLGRRLPALRIPEYAFLFGKCMGTGVMLAVGFVHLLGEAEQHFQVWCVPVSFYNTFPSWAPAFAVLAVMLMHAIDLIIGELVHTWYEEQPHLSDNPQSQQTDHSSVREMLQPHSIVTATPAPLPWEISREDPMTKDKGHGVDGAMEVESVRAGEDLEEDPMLREEHSAGKTDYSRPTHTHSLSIHSVKSSAPSNPSHGDKSKAQLVVAAICMEFGTTLHSIFVGLDCGVMSDTKIRPMLIALVFHQTLEGLAMGSRIADAAFLMWLEMAMMWMFACSAPLGALAGTLAVNFASSTALAGPTYVLISSVLDAMCGGILVYLGLTLMIGDFPRDLKRARALVLEAKRSATESVVILTPNPEKINPAARATVKDSPQKVVQEHQAESIPSGSLHTELCGTRVAPLSSRLVKKIRYRQYGLFLALWIGAAGMCVVGKWC